MMSKEEIERISKWDGEGHVKLEIRVIMNKFRDRFWLHGWRIIAKREGERHTINVSSVHLLEGLVSFGILISTRKHNFINELKEALEDVSRILHI